MKLVNEVLAKFKGEKNITSTLTGKGSYSSQGFKELTNALLNDTTFKVESMDKNGEKVQMNLSELIRKDLKKTYAGAGFPQGSEIKVLDTCKIHTDGYAEAIRRIALEWVRCGKKLDFPAQQDMVASIYLAPVKAKTRVLNVHGIKNKEDLGTATITTKDSIQMRAKSPVPKHLQTKVRKDKDGKII
jgi:hypothetical protein